MALRTMKNMREIDQATATYLQSRGGLLSLDHGDDDEDVGEGGDPSGGDPDGVSPLQSSLQQPSFSCFYVCAALSSRELFGAIYIVIFRSKYAGG